MVFSQEIRDVVSECLRGQLPFVLYALPGSDSFAFYSCPADNGVSEAFDDENADCFFINFFDNDEPYTAGVKFRFDLAATADYLKRNRDILLPLPVNIKPKSTPTFPASYHYAFSEIIPRLKKDGGKTVLSRLRVTESDKSPLDVAEDYFALTSQTFRYLCFTPETGFWIGSTPELLLMSDRHSSRFSTMALAGTRSADDNTPWDSKNIGEQALVTFFISSLLQSEGLDVDILPTEELKFLNVKHLCTKIEAKGDVNVRELLSLLSPTPAVAGFPRDEAVEEIERLETHRRYCYGGYVGVRIAGDYKTFVNLRCCFAAKASIDSEWPPRWLYNLYCGGGIVADSDEKSEWEETTAKSERLMEIIISN